jgi:hypothetical protein
MLSNFNRTIRRQRDRRRIRLQRHRINRIYRRHAPINNTLNQIAPQLPLQITNDSFAIQIFNESYFF